MYTDEVKYEDYKSWREDMEFIDRFMNQLDSLLDEQVNQTLEEDEQEQHHTLSRR